MHVSGCSLTTVAAVAPRNKGRVDGSRFETVLP